MRIDSLAAPGSINNTQIFLLDALGCSTPSKIPVMCRLIDLTNQRFGRYLVVARSGTGPNGMATWLCRCDCGSEKIVIGNNLRMGKVLSCGCYQREIAVRNGLATRKHGRTRTAVYKSWMSMKSRCLNPGDQAYSYYGGRGINVCPRWANSFENFLHDMGERPKGHTLERINVNGDYEPNNCIWCLPKDQSLIKRTTLKVVYNGCEMPLLRAAELSGIPYRVLLTRKNRLGWPIEKLFSPYNKRKSSSQNAV